ncbi:MAG: phosphate ABC transporter substrate-binding protein [Cellvibrionales bacterium]|nr:phosphate ABC transporter substrate-binding protein [Cellvibrionales bacterium]
MLYCNLTKSLPLLLAGFLCVSLFAFSVPAKGDIAIIVHPSNTNTITLKRVKKIFLAKTQSFPDGKPVKAFQMDFEPLRTAFNRNVLNRSEKAVNYYWARMLFSSKAKPPVILQNADHIKTIVASQPEAIAYIDIKDVDPSVRVCLVVKSSHDTHGDIGRQTQ